MENAPEKSPCLSAKPDAAINVHQKILSLLLTEKTGLVLDVPAGEGALADSIQKLGFGVRCGDIDVSRFKLNGIQCDKVDLNKNWPYSTSHFDYVVLVEAIEHLENPWHIVREANRVLKLEGLLLVSTPNVLTLKSRLSYLLYGYPNFFHYMIEKLPDHTEDLPIDHINPIGYLELRHVLSRNGFQVETLETNRYVKRRSLLHQAIRLLLLTRGRSHTRYKQYKSDVRQTLLSPTLLFGEILIVKSRKIRELNSRV